MVQPATSGKLGRANPIWTRGSARGWRGLASMAWVVCALAPGGLTLAASGRGTPSIHASQFADLRHGDQGSAGGSATHRRSRQAGRGTWSCVLLSNMTLAEGVWWTKQNCTGTVPEALDPHVGPIIVNIGHAALSTTSASVANPPMIRPGVARTPLGLAKLHDIAANTSVEVPGFKPLIGVNGGYFFEVNREDFIDDVCFGKFRKAALEPASMTDPNAGIGDSLTIINGTYASSNCDKIGNSKPVAAVLDSPPRFVKLGRGERLPSSVRWAIGAGPNLVSFNDTTGQSYIDVEGDNVNIVEHSSNTAIALRGDEFMLVTFDGSDLCPNADPTCGINSRQFAGFLLDHVGADTAMEMDQGGSTVMWVNGQPGTVPGEPGVVSNPGRGERLLFNGIFIGIGE